MKILILFYSTFGHVYKMALSVAEGASEVEGSEVLLRRVPETLSEAILEKMGASKAQEEMKHIPVITLPELGEADAIIFGTPTRFGNMCGQMRQFLDSTGGLWAKRALVGKIGSVFTSTGTQHGGQESTILSFHTTLLHHGMLIAGLPYSFEEQGITDEVMGCSPYGASTIAGGRGERQPTARELAGARFQGKHVAELARRFK
ncbi:MAG: NAD(P)H:quinone oxidoreductase [Candidatus Coatesbacteria bacterium]|nr:NAD(P)H:quinone oxidoreductase [Candidatus Coatesbacteria bacterium]